ncbi:MAG: T9SS type A sorting domain-containing protein [Bacteroidales bacterium]|nr:T9SS type A sorting domain-containing protein [Bacteroidales bacterium]
MKSPGHLIFISVCLIIFTGNFISQTHSSVTAQTLSYIESSSGLANPEWEGGRTELEFADINADGLLDIITIGDHGSPFINTEEHGIMVYYGDGAGNWSVQMTGDFGYGGIAAGDVNNDGFLDVGYAMHHNYSSTDFGDQLIEVALGDGTGINWTPWDDGLATNGEDYGMFATDFADVDNDGDLDLGSISFGCCAGIHVYLNNSDGTWTQSFGVLDGNSDMIFQFGDINNDGFIDFIAGYENGTVYFGDGTGDFILKDLNLPSGGLMGRLGPSLGDIENDGGMDLAFANNNGGLHVYIFDDWDQLWQDFSGDLPSTGPFEHTQLADMNMDGFIDLAAYGEGTFQVFLGDGNGNWTADATFTTGDPGYSQAFRVGGDVDHNGRPDIVLLEEEELSWFTYQNYLRCYRESSVPILLDIKPVYPRGWERFRPNSVRFIDWISTVPGNEPATVKLEYSTIGSNGPMTLIADGLPNSGRYQWIVPQENSVTCYIRYTITSGTSTYSSTTSRAFMILDGGIGIDEPKPESMGISVYPNPAGRQLTVDSWQSAVKMVITDLFGRRIKECANISSFPFLLDISDLQPGMYILRAINKDGESGSAKFLKISL